MRAYICARAIIACKITKSILNMQEKDEKTQKNLSMNQNMKN